MSNNITEMFPENYVSLVSKDLIYLENVSEDVIKELDTLNAKKGELEARTIWEIAFLSRLELAEKLRKLNELGFLFAGSSHGWPPAEIVADLRERKMLTGSFKEVRWRRHDDWFVIER
ncbi:MAG TPA: hypothetical protein VJ987_12750 [Anaerolineales bacterium]|nr:hypothetical protein [Anaerolineales bacterium]